MQACGICRRQGSQHALCHSWTLHRTGNGGQYSTCCCSQRDDRLSSTRLLQALVRPRSASAAHSATPGAVHPEACASQSASPSGSSSQQGADHMAAAVQAPDAPALPSVGHVKGGHCMLREWLSAASQDHACSFS